jgi:hypothetical protein
VTFANWCKTLLHFIWLPFSYNLAKSNTFLHVSPKITEPDWSATAPPFKTTSTHPSFSKSWKFYTILV